MKTPFRFWLVPVLMLTGLLCATAQNKTTTITIQTQEPDGTMSTKTYTFDGDDAEDVDWNTLLNNEVDLDQEVVMDITLADEAAEDPKAWMGIYHSSLKQGVVQVTDVVPNSPAAKAGLKRGDIIRKFNGVDINSEADLTTVLRQYRPDDQVTLVVEFKEKTREVPFVLGSRKRQGWGNINIPDIRIDDNLPEGEGFRVYVDNKPKLGITIIEGEEGVRIESVRPDSPADQGGLQPGDEITALDNAQVNNTESLINEIQLRAVGDSVLVTFKRKGQEEVRVIELRALEDFGRRMEQTFERRPLERPLAPNKARSRTVTIEKRVKLGERPTPPDASELVLEQLDLYPNPSSETLTVALRTTDAASVVLVLSSVEGQEIARHEQTPANGTVKHSFDIGSLAAGQYVLVIQQNDKTLTERVIVRD
jgi:PDZ domain-containing secreted protein